MPEYQEPMPTEQADYGTFEEMAPTHHDRMRLQGAMGFVSPHISQIFSMLHGSGIVRDGQQVTICAKSLCGFEGYIVLRVGSVGTCPDQSGKPGHDHHKDPKEEKSVHPVLRNHSAHEKKQVPVPDSAIRNRNPYLN